MTGPDTGAGYLSGTDLTFQIDFFPEFALCSWIRQSFWPRRVLMAEDEFKCPYQIQYRKFVI
jgi:hypothetical protein